MKKKAVKKPRPKIKRTKTKHVPVMLKEVLKYLQPKSGKIFVDATLGMGGHSKELAKKVGKGKLISLDQDELTLRETQQNFNGTRESVIFVCDNFRNIGQVLRNLEYDKVDGILFDLGISSWQLEHHDRGFSFMEEGPLDMRMSRDGSLKAEDIVNSYSQKDISLILKKYGEEKNASRISRAIVRERDKRPILTTTQLADVIKATTYGYRKIHPATQTFQALRIAVNHELEALTMALSQAVDHLKPGGRVAVISFHSLEDRIVKETFKRFALKCICPPDFPHCVCGETAILDVVTKKPVIATKTEIKTNPRARSAKLRVAEKLQ